MDDQIKQLVERIALLEREVATLTAEAKHARLRYATKVELINAGVPVAIIEANYVTKEDMAKLRGEIVARGG